MTKTKKLRRPLTMCAFGGDMDDEEKQQYAQTAGIAGSLGSGILDAVANRNDFGNMSTGTMMGKTALQGAAMGSRFGPLGTVAGTVLGAGLGLLQGGKLRRQERDIRSANVRNTLINENNYSAALIGANPELVSGYKGASMFAAGGDIKAPLASADMQGGTATSLSSDSVELNGNSHAQGGIQIPQVGAEVEGGETAKGSYVFSKELGFAKLHRPIAKAIGVIEKKPQTPERINSLRRLERQENELAMAQESVKALHRLS
jgi:hypothetical protein